MLRVVAAVALAGGGDAVTALRELSEVVRGMTQAIQNSKRNAAEFALIKRQGRLLYLYSSTHGGAWVEARGYQPHNDVVATTPMQLAHSSRDQLPAVS